MYLIKPQIYTDFYSSKTKIERRLYALKPSVATAKNLRQSAFCGDGKICVNLRNLWFNKKQKRLFSMKPQMILIDTDFYSSKTKILRRFYAEKAERSDS